MKRIWLLFVFIITGLFLSACEQSTLECEENYVIEDDTCMYVDPYAHITTVDPYYIGHTSDPGETTLQIPSWIDDAVMYEVNIRQYTEEGTIEAFIEHLPRLQELGVEILWFMPLHPISLEKRIDDLGSYYAVQDFYDINPEFGSLDDFITLVDTAHEMGFKVIMDMVFNHTGWDHSWITDHPEWYTTSNGEIIHPPGTNWLDVADLNFSNDALVEELGKILTYWVDDYHIDGFRFDYAAGVPKSVWNSLRHDVETIKPDTFFLAEDNSRFDWFHIFHSNYGGWTLLHHLEGMYNNTSSIDDLEDYLRSSNGNYLLGTFPLNFTTNHDINSWEGTHEERLGESYPLMSMLTFTLPGMPLLYSGQESSNEHSLAFFTKDQINWNGYAKQAFYEDLIDLKQENDSLYNDNASNSLYFVHSDHAGVFSFIRTRDGSTNQILVIANMTDQPLTAKIHLGEFAATWYNHTENREQTLHRIEEISLQAYSYHIFIIE